MLTEKILFNSEEEVDKYLETFDKGDIFVCQRELLENGQVKVKITYFEKR